MSINWVMLTQDGKIVPKPGERILHTTRPRVALEITTPASLGLSEPFSLRSDSGTGYITNERVIYLPARATESFQSFFAPILHFDDTDVQSSWGGIGPWSWSGVVKPVNGGGIPPHIPRLDAKLVFKDGGHYDWRTRFNLLKERLHHARELGLVPSENTEPPPPYEASSAAPDHTAVPASDDVAAPDRDAQPQPAPTGPPPDYAEAQAQALSMQHEQRTREESERD